MLPPEILEAAAQVADTAARTKPVETLTILGLLFLVVSQSGVWLEKLLANSRARAERKRAEADEAEAKLAAARLAASSPAGAGNPGNAKPGNGSGSEHKDFILPHALALERHEGEIRTLKGTTEKLERENREDHGKIFQKLDDLKDLLTTGDDPRT
jgi:hypothetical protein